jgi:hypothetical protein
MFLLRFRSLHIFLALMIPMLLGALLQNAPMWTSENLVRLQVTGINCSTFFALVFVLWIGTLVYKLAPRENVRWTILAGLALGVAFRAWQDSWAIDWVYMTGQQPAVEEIDPTSPLFILHALVSLFMLFTFVLIARWLVIREKMAGINRTPFWLTLVQLLAFPVGLWWIHPRAKRLFGPSLEMPDSQ